MTKTMIKTYFENEIRFIEIFNFKQILISILNKMNKEFWIQPLLFTFSCTSFYFLTSRLIAKTNNISSYENKLSLYEEKFNCLESRISDLEEFRHKMCESTLALSQQRHWDENASSDDEIISD